MIVKAKDSKKIHEKANVNGMNLRHISNDSVGISLDETSTENDIKAIIEIFDDEQNKSNNIEQSWDKEFDRATAFLTHEVFNSHHSETQILRYIKSLADKDIALDRCMIPLGSCTMKLNATTEMIPVGWNGFANMHPHAPEDQAHGYLEIIKDLEDWLTQRTGYKAISLQPNAGSQGEYAGL